MFYHTKFGLDYMMDKSIDGEQHRLVSNKFQEVCLPTTRNIFDVCRQLPMTKPPNSVNSSSSSSTVTRKPIWNRKNHYSATITTSCKKINVDIDATTNNGVVEQIEKQQKPTNTNQLIDEIFIPSKFKTHSPKVQGSNILKQQDQNFHNVDIDYDDDVIESEQDTTYINQLVDELFNSPYLNLSDLDEDSTKLQGSDILPNNEIQSQQFPNNITHLVDDLTVDDYEAMDDISKDIDKEMITKCSQTTTTINSATTSSEVSHTFEMDTTHTNCSATTSPHVDLNNFIISLSNTELTYLIGISMTELEKRRANLFLPPPPSHCKKPPPTQHDHPHLISLLTTNPPPPPTTQEQSQLQSLLITNPPPPPPQKQSQIQSLLTTNAPPPPPTQKQSQLQYLPDTNKTSHRAISAMQGHLSRGMLYLDGKDTRSCWNGPLFRLKQNFQCVCGRGAFACPDCKTHEQTWESFVIHHYGATVFRGKPKKLLCSTFS